jgi:hypothetical protein
MSLINVSTNHASVFTVDAVTYANCLESSSSTYVKPPRVTVGNMNRLAQ